MIQLGDEARGKKRSLGKRQDVGGEWIVIYVTAPVVCDIDKGCPRPQPNKGLRLCNSV